MELEKITLLEQKISRLLDGFSALKNDKARLEERVSQLEKDLREERENGKLLKEKARDMEALEEKNRQYVKDRETARQKLEGILEKIERIDFC